MKALNCAHSGVERQSQYKSATQLTVNTYLTRLLMTKGLRERLSV
jgi:hypothetical protein